MLAVTCACVPLFCLSVLGSEYLCASELRGLTGSGYQCHYEAWFARVSKHFVTPGIVLFITKPLSLDQVNALIHYCISN